jgi:hypothetical protein
MYVFLNKATKTMYLQDKTVSNMRLCNFVSNLSKSGLRPLIYVQVRRKFVTSSERGVRYSCTENARLGSPLGLSPHSTRRTHPACFFLHLKVTRIAACFRSCAPEQPHPGERKIWQRREPTTGSIIASRKAARNLIENNLCDQKSRNRKVKFHEVSRPNV